MPLKYIAFIKLNHYFLYERERLHSLKSISSLHHVWQSVSIIITILFNACPTFIYFKLGRNKIIFNLVLHATKNFIQIECLKPKCNISNSFIHLTRLTWEA